MKKKILFGSVIAIAVASGIIFAADHIDAPAVTGANSTSTGADITDVYAFQSPSDNSKMVFVMNVQGLMSPAVTSAASFPGIGSEWKNKSVRPCRSCSHRNFQHGENKWHSN